MKTLGNPPLLYLITDRKLCPSRSILELIVEAARAGVDLIQIREKDLPIRELCALVEEAAARIAGTPARLLVNDRFDVAVTCGAHGVHLTTRSLPAAIVREIVGPDVLIGVSAHSLEEARDAEIGGADFLVLGPVFETPSKKPYGPPLGLEAFACIAVAVRLPVLAIGGITPENAPQVLARGAAGIAAIRMFVEAEQLIPLVARLKGH
ncbi:MAG: thiamine phosphate synthase [Blastocatellia bacterium]|nr:thiamine phosphate synthase [Blastocatellia bacterium]MCX7751241.1 thiamine phosphate synthase [Blastocatellia bacterium]MDW8256713.1 thiamine phosphate synthase [Acidobacteriota bacterium]